jgi:hypothetical protein
MSNRRSIFLIGLGLFSAFLLAFPLRVVVERVIIAPAAYFLWLLGTFYRFIPQEVVWILLLLGMFYVAVASFYAKPWEGDVPGKPLRLHFGPVENLARLVEHKTPGVYFKWQVARLIAETVIKVQTVREHSPSRDLKLQSGMPPEVRKYLEAGLNTSFADYPFDGNPLLPARFRKPPNTPFDIDLDAVVTHLESQLENNDDRKHS